MGQTYKFGKCWKRFGEHTSKLTPWDYTTTLNSELPKNGLKETNR